MNLMFYYWFISTVVDAILFNLCRILHYLLKLILNVNFCNMLYNAILIVIF